MTLLVEVPIYSILLARLLKVRAMRAVALGTVVNLVTHPNVWFTLYPSLEPWFGYPAYVLCAEIFAWLLEALVLWLFLRRSTLGLFGPSLLANGASFGLGFVLYAQGLLL